MKLLHSLQLKFVGKNMYLPQQYNIYFIRAACYIIFCDNITIVILYT